MALEVAISAARKETPRSRRWASSWDLEGEGEERVDGRMRRVMAGRDGVGELDRERRIGRPSSPAPRTRTRTRDIILFSYQGEEYEKETGNFTVRDGGIYTIGIHTIGIQTNGVSDVLGNGFTLP